MHELPDRPPPYQGPPALERRESNRSRHEVCLGPRFHEPTSQSWQPVNEQTPDRRGPHNLRAENYLEGGGARRVRFFLQHLILFF